MWKCMWLCVRYTVKLGYNKLGYNEHTVILNNISRPKWPFSTQINPVITNPGYNGQICWSRAVRYDQVWLYRENCKWDYKGNFSFTWLIQFVISVMDFDKKKLFFHFIGFAENIGLKGYL